MEIIIPAATDFLSVIIYVLIFTISGIITIYFRERYGVEKMHRIADELKNEESIAYRSLMLIKESLQESGLVDDNLQKTTEWTSKILKNKGIRVKPDEVEDIIKSVYNEFKEQFIGDWTDIIEKEK